jgi:2-C-methyl-D-erythritol 4-phosphate cytidylyltransferase / 2-C-methyl-D-erythritol 2,4-cyclodiphosphate synthase
MRCWGLIVAGGQGRRSGRATPKQYVSLLHRPLLWWSLAAFEQCPSVEGVVLVLTPEGIAPVRSQLGSWAFHKVQQLCVGGTERVDSVEAGLAQLPAGVELVAIHDAARPLITVSLIETVVALAAREGAALPALPLRETIKQSDGLRVQQTLDRRALFAAQTPQTFRVDLIRRAYANRDRAARVTDDAQLVEQLGYTVHLTEGDPENLKITLSQDWTMAEHLLQRRGVGLSVSPAIPRTGFGYDVHRLVPGRTLVLGGVELPFARGLLGHSDADVLCHAVGDALLGAAGLGDLGQLFPPGDPRFCGARSLDLLAQIVAQLQAAGHRVGNVDAVVVCEQPRLAPHAVQIRENLARILRVTPGQVSVKATTTEGLGPMGRQEGIAAYATVLIMPACG